MLGLGLGLNKSGSNFTYHVSTWNTENISTGSSNNNQIKIPLGSNPQNFVVYWGDGTSNSITSYNQAETTHTYSVAGIYKIKIVGQCTNFGFNNSGDRLKLLNIKNGGKNFSIFNTGGAFYGCANLTSIKNLKTVGITNFTATFRGCTVLNCPLNLDTSLATTMYTFLYQATAFNHPVKQLSIANCTNLNLMLSSTALSNSNYSDALIAWQAATHQNSVTLAATAKYESRALAARTALLADGWTINDGGAA